MSDEDKKTSDSSIIEQSAKDDTTQLGEVIGDVNFVTEQFIKHPVLLYCVLFLTILGMSLVGWQITGIVGGKNDYLVYVGKAMCTVPEPGTDLLLTQLPIQLSALAKSLQNVVPTRIPPTTAPTINDLPTSTPTPPSPTGTWSGFTDQGNPISFEVGNSRLGQVVYNISSSYTFAAPCPIGKISFSTLDQELIGGGPTYYFRQISVQASNPETDVNVEGSFKSDFTNATGNVQLTTVEKNCPFVINVGWSATKQY